MQKNATLMFFASAFFITTMFTSIPGAVLSQEVENDWLHIEYFGPDDHKKGLPDPPRTVPDHGWENDNLLYDYDSYGVFEKELHGVNLIVAVHNDTNWDHHQNESYANLIFSAWARYWEIFEGFLYDEYRVLVDDGYDGSRGYGFIDDFPINGDNSYINPGMAPHSVFHAWNGGGSSSIMPIDRPREHWFGEGVTAYYEQRADFLFGGGSPRSMEELQSMFCLQGIVRYYEEEIVAKGDDMPLIEMGPSFDQTDKAYNYYAKGLLVAYLLDRRLNEHGYNLDLLMREIYHRLDYGDIKFSAEDVLDICEFLTDGHCADLFEDYVYGESQLPFDDNYEFNFFQNTLDEPFIFTGNRFEAGDGTANHPYVIATPEQLNRIRDYPSSHFQLANDINMKDVGNWEPVGNSMVPFTGVVDGAGNRIKNLTIDYEEMDSTGMFRNTGDAVIKNIGLKNVYINGRDYVGGMIGSATDTVISESFVSGFISGRNWVGGLIGFLDASSESEINNSYVNCNIVGESAVGGLSSRFSAGDRIQNSYSVSMIEGSNSMGGLAGYNNGIAGENVVNSFWDYEIGPSTSPVGEGKPTSSMMKHKTYDKWDFNSVWAIKDGASYPYLQWQGEPEDEDGDAPHEPDDPKDEDDLGDTADLEDEESSSSSGGCFIETLNSLK